jgi:hypothetical protein
MVAGFVLVFSRTAVGMKYQVYFKNAKLALISQKETRYKQSTSHAMYSL